MNLNIRPSVCLFGDLPANFFGQEQGNLPYTEEGQNIVFYREAKLSGNVNEFEADLAKSLDAAFEAYPSAEWISLQPK